MGECTVVEHLLAVWRKLESDYGDFDGYPLMSNHYISEMESLESIINSTIEGVKRFHKFTSEVKKKPLAVGWR